MVDPGAGVTSGMIAVTLSALGLGAGALRIVQWALHSRSTNNNGKRTWPPVQDYGETSWERKITAIVSQNSNDKILPLLTELKRVAEKQVDIQQELKEILIELVTISKYNNGERR